MEYAKDIILNVGYKRLSGLRSWIGKAKNILKRTKEALAVIFCIIKKWTGIVTKSIMNNKLISLTLVLLVLLIAADFILIDNFMKIFVTLY